MKQMQICANNDNNLAPSFTFILLKQNCRRKYLVKRSVLRAYRPHTGELHVLMVIYSLAPFICFMNINSEYIATDFIC